MSQQYIVSARKYRPATFRSVVGQKALTSTLKNAIDSGRLAQAYLFTGPRGVGKTSCARIFAKTINCMNLTADGEACGECDSCRSIAEGNSMNVVELDAASNNSVDDIRNINEQVNIPPQTGKYRVFIIDEVHMLSSQAFNAFLKTLEEPPRYVIFILATTEKHKVIATILSRCQIYDFKRITIADMVEHLQYVAGCEGIEAETAALNVVARKADGGMRDALSIFDQVAAYSGGKITYQSTIANLNVLDYEYYFRLVECFRAADVQSSLMLYKEIRDKGFDSLFFLGGLASHVRDLMVAAEPSTMPLLEVAEEIGVRYTEQARTLPLPWYYAAMKLINDCDLNYRTSSNKQFLVELLLIRLCQLLDPPKAPFSRIDEGIPLQVTPSASAAQPAPAPQPQPAPAPQARVTPQAAVPKARPAQQSVASSPAQSSPAQSSPAQPPPVRQSPAASVAPPAAPRPAARHAAGRGGSMSLSGLQQSALANTTVKASRKENVTLEGFASAWTQYQVANPEKHILVSAMAGGKLEQTAAEAFQVTVDHPAQVQAFELEMQSLLEYIRDCVRNDFVTLSVRINTDEVVKQLPPAELLKEIVRKNPAMGNMLADIDAELG